MKKKAIPQKIYLATLILILYATGCTTSPVPNLTPTRQATATVPTQTSTHTLTPAPVRTNTKTPPPSPMINETITPTRVNLMDLITDIPLTPLPTEQVQAWIRKMMKDNGGCRLPCWWGITPGKTTWEDAKMFLSPYASRISIMQIGGDLDTAIYFFWPPQDVTMSFLALSFSVRDNIVQSISLTGIEQAAAYRLPELMSVYGEPGAVYINAYSGWAYDDHDPRDVSIHIYYPQEGIFAQYVAPDSKVENGTIHGCIQYGTLVNLWAPIDTKTYTITLQTITLNFQFPSIPVSKALGMDIHHFYETYKGENKEVCIETPVDLWVWGTTSTPTP